MRAPRVELDRPWLTLDLGAEMRVLSWALNRPGFTRARRIIWREVRNANLPPELDAKAWLAAALAERGETDSVAFLTSRNVDAFQVSEASVDGTSAFAVATVGLSNAERVGHRSANHAGPIGTINVAVRLNTGLTQTGLIEALSIAVEARTVAILDADIRRDGVCATGTGTDCLVVAAPEGPLDYAGLHTETGQALGRAVYDAVRAGAEAWTAEQEADAHA